MKRCYRCTVLLDNINSATEHIIINACGGKLKSKNLLCKNCNSFFGSTFDKELADQTNDLMNILGAKREKGEARPVKGKAIDSGDEYYFHVNDKIERIKPAIKDTGSGANRQLSIQSPNMKMLKQVLKGYKRTNPDIDVDAAIKSARESFERVEGEINFNMSVGGDDTFRAITKTAINFYIFKDGERHFIEHLLPYLDQSEKQDVVWMHYPDNLIYFPNEKEISHVIKLVGNPEENILYAYIELFNCHNYLLQLNTNYTGKAINKTYVFNVIERQAIDIHIDLTYKREHLLSFFSNKNYHPFENVKRAFSRVVTLSRVLSNDRKMEKAFWRAWNLSLGEYPVGTIITDEMSNQFCRLYARELVPFLNLNHKHL